VNTDFGIYVGKEGLQRAINELLAFKTKHYRLPKYKDTKMERITGAIYNRQWISFGIKTWNDLLRNTFGEINTENGKYCGEQGLNRVITELQDFKIKHSRLPTVSRDKEMRRIYDAIRRGEWTFDGIKTWNDLLRKTFGEVNIEIGIYTGEQGLIQAMAELRNFKIENNRLPTSMDKMMGGIIGGAINRGEWALDGIKTWNDLLSTYPKSRKTMT
jgi:hypothetical protein